MIRKIVIGPDYKQGMSFTIGQSFGGVIVDTIRRMVGENTTYYEIYVKDSSGAIMLWKVFENMPVSIEMDISSF